MGFKELRDDVKNSSDGGSYKDLKDAEYKLVSGKPATMKFVPESFVWRTEMWFPKTDVPISDPNKKDICVVLKNSTGFNTMAQIIGSPAEWKIGNQYAFQPNMYKGGLLEYKYLDEKDENDFKIKEFRHVRNPAHHEFFKKAFFDGKEFEITKAPSRSPKMAFYALVLIHGDSWSDETKKYRWIGMPLSIYKQLNQQEDENFPLSNFWFKLSKDGEGMKTRYKVTVVTPDSIGRDLNGLYDFNSYQKYDLSSKTNLTPDYIVWHYSKSLVKEADDILGTHYAEKMEADYEANKSKIKSETSGDDTPTESETSIPNVVKDEFSKVPAGAAAIDPHAMSDDDIPF